MKKCELCNSEANLYCESDQANLCWSCDTRVHASNFLVSNHSRTLLCHVCQSPTPWNGSGPKLTTTVSLCPTCINNNANITTREHAEDGDHDTDNQDDDDEENQVVPWSPTPQPPTVSRTSSSEEYATRFSSAQEILTGWDIASSLGFMHSTTRFGHHV